MRNPRAIKIKAYLLVALVVVPLCFTVFGYLHQFVQMTIGFRQGMRGVSLGIVLESWVIWGIYGMLFSWVFLIARRQVIAFALAGMLGLSIPMIINDLAITFAGTTVFRILALSVIHYVFTGVACGLLAYVSLQRLGLIWSEQGGQTSHAA